MKAHAATPEAYGLIMSLLTALFFLRMTGQALVAFFHVTFLPDMQEWYSGLIPYRVLLPIQCAMLAVMVKVSWDLVKGHGFFVAARAKLGRFLVAFSCVYFAAMLFRYIVTMLLNPERRWLGGTIPIFFHFVLAGYLFVWGRFNAMRGGAS
jgi:hypothetical protein